MALTALIWPERSRELTLKDVSGILPRGGTILGTTNRGNPFCYKTIENGQEVVRDISDEVIANTRKLGIDAVISIGGDGSMKIANELFMKGLQIVGVPKTIDNDLSATEVTFGFDTAIHTATDAIDKLHTTAESHHRVMVVEVMGRDAGWIALEAGIAGGAHVILIPEIPFYRPEAVRAPGDARTLRQALHDCGGGGGDQAASGDEAHGAQHGRSATWWAMRLRWWRARKCG